MILVDLWQGLGAENFFYPLLLRITDRFVLCNDFVQTDLPLFGRIISLSMPTARVVTLEDLFYKEVMSSKLLLLLENIN